MNNEIEITNDGKMMCPDCLKNENEITLLLHILSHRKDCYVARFNVIEDTLVTVGDNPVDGDTLEVYDKYLHCPRCGGR